MTNRAKLRAIIIDDRISNITTLRALIEDQHADDLDIVGTAYVIEEGFRLIKEKKPDVVFLDIDMPRGGGFDLLERIPRRYFEVVFVSAFENFKNKAMGFGAFDFVAKPIDMKIFADVIHRLVIFRNENPDKVYKL
jgi:two-component system, LytTR family, response regulator